MTTNSDLNRTRELVAEARELAEPYLPTETPEHAEYDLAVRLLVMAELAAAGLALRDAVMHPLSGGELGIVGAVIPRPALNAYDDAIRAALPPEPGAGDKGVSGG